MLPARVLESCDHFERRLVGLPAAARAGRDRGSRPGPRPGRALLRARGQRAHAVWARPTCWPHARRSTATSPAGSPSAVGPLDDLIDMLAETLRAAAPEAVDDPSIVVLSDGPSNSAWYEHERIARALSIPVVTLRGAVGLGRPADRTRGRPAHAGGRRLPQDERGSPRGRARQAHGCRRDAARSDPRRQGQLRQRVRRRRRGRQADARLRREDGALLPRRGAAAGFGAHLRRGRCPTSAARCSSASTSS